MDEGSSPRSSALACHTPRIVAGCDRGSFAAPSEGGDLRGPGRVEADLVEVLLDLTAPLREPVDHRPVDAGHVRRSPAPPGSSQPRGGS